MSSIELQLYELLKLKLGEKETKVLIDFVEDSAKAQKESFSTKLDIEKTKSELAIEIEKTRNELLIKIEKIQANVSIVKWMLGVVIAGILSLIVKSFF